MNNDIQAFDIRADGNTTPIEFFKDFPEVCPECEKNIFPRGLSYFYSEKSHSEPSNVIGTGVGTFQCPKCREIFAVHYSSIERIEHVNRTTLKPKRNGSFIIDQVEDAYAPRLRANISIPDEISNISPRFVTTFQQSSQAEKDKMNELCGMGYRKAIEILIIDFMIKYPPNGSVTEEWLTNPKTSANQKIEKLGDENLTTLAKAISWIGNDETHYTRLNYDKDIEAMKKFIKVLIALIEQKIVMLEAMKFINK